MSRKPPLLHAATDPHPFSWARLVLGALMSVALFTGSTVWFVYQDLAHQVSKNVIDISAIETPQSEGPKAPGDSFEGRALNVLLVGVDTRQGQGDAYGSAEEITSVRSDTTMVMHISADRSRVQVVSIPRDLIVEIPACTRTDGSVSGWTTGMFNSAITIGANWGDDLVSGIACTKTTVEHITGLAIDAFAVVDFNGFASMVESLGGVWMDIPEAIDDPLSDLRLSQGCQRLNGHDALGYARARYSLGDGSDISRIGRQQQLVGAMMREALSKNFVTDLPALLSFVKAALGALQTSPNLGDLNTSAGLLLSLASIDRARIEFVTLPNYPNPADPNRVLALEPVTTNLWQALAQDAEIPVGIQYTNGYGDVLTKEAPAPAPDPATQSGTTSANGTAEASGTTGTSTAEANAPQSQQVAAPVVTCPPQQ